MSTTVSGLLIDADAGLVFVLLKRVGNYVLGFKVAKLCLNYSTPCTYGAFSSLNI